MISGLLADGVLVLHVNAGSYGLVWRRRVRSD